MDWRIIENETEDHWLALEGTDGNYVTEPDGSVQPQPIYYTHAVAKWDGCVIFENFANGYGWNHDCEGDECRCARQAIHICDVDSFVADLLALKSAAQRFYADKNGSEYWPTETAD